MSETAKWQIHTGDSLPYRNGESWFTKPNGEEVDLFDIPATLDALETSLAEAQKERDDDRASYKRSVGDAQRIFRERLEEVMVLRNSRAEAAEQQLAEVRTSHLAAERELIESESRCERLQIKLAELESFKRELERRHAV